MTTLGGLPAHALLVHAVVVLVPATAVLVVLASLRPQPGRWLWTSAVAFAAVTLAFIPVTTEAGEWLEHHVPRNDLVSRHTSLGDTLLPWVTGLLLIAAAVGLRAVLSARRQADPDGPGAASATRLRALVGGRPVTAILAIIAIVVGAGAVSDTYRIGESGARAAWTGHFSERQLWGRQHK